MKDNIPTTGPSLWKQLNEMTARDFIRWLPEYHLSLFAATVLSVLAATPVLISLLFREPTEYLADLMEGAEANLIYTYVFGSQWFQMLLMLGFFTTLVAVLVFARQIDANGLAGLKPGCIRENLLPTGLALMLLWSVVSALLSGNPRVCFLGDDYRQEGVLTYCFYATVFITAMQLSEKHMKWVAEVLCATCAVSGTLVITGGKLIPGLFYLEQDLRAAMFHQYNHYGYFLAICFPLCFGLVLQDGKPSLPLRILRLAEFWLICNAIAFNSVRGSFVAILAALGGWNLAVFIGHRSHWKKLMMLDLIFAVTILGLNTGSTLLERMDFLFREMEQVQQNLPTASESEVTAAIDNLGTERVLLWRLGIQFAMEKPVFGYGPDNLGHLYTAVRYNLPDRPHNELIQFAASLGFPALAFYVTAIGSHVGAFFRHFRKLSLFHLALFASAGCYLVSSMFGNTMYYTTPYYIMMLAFSFRIIQNHSNDELIRMEPH